MRSKEDRSKDSAEKAVREIRRADCCRRIAGRMVGSELPECGTTLVVCALAAKIFTTIVVVWVNRAAMRRFQALEDE